MRQERQPVRPVRQFVGVILAPEAALLDVVVDRQDDLESDLAGDLDSLDDDGQLLLGGIPLRPVGLDLVPDGEREARFGRSPAGAGRLSCPM
jgi:hypothetical protein